MLRIEGLTKAYTPSMPPIIHELSLNVPDGSSVSIRGASGSGKSTLLSLIAGFEVPDAGSIHIGDISLPLKKEREGDHFRRHHLGVVFQSYNLLDCLTVEDNIAFTARLKGNHLLRYQHEIMIQLGIAHLNNQPVSELSGGEQQRVAIARALVHKPSLVLADEPTGNLDESTSDKVSETLYRICHDLHTTLIVVTHSQDVAEKAQMHRWLRRGKLEQAGF